MPLCEARRAMPAAGALAGASSGPDCGRLWTSDPARLAERNFHAYVMNDPVNFIDPAGLQDITVTGPSNPRNRPQNSPGVRFGNSPSSTSLGNDEPDFGQECLVDDPHCVTVRGRRKSASRKTSGSPHRYGVSYPTLCSAREAFNRLLEPGMSAPGAPRAREGVNTVILYGGNPISQIVDLSRLRITNITLPGHRFHPGQVVINVVPAGSGSDVNIEGTGSGGSPWFNNLVGTGFFGLSASSIMQACAPGYAPLVP